MEQPVPLPTGVRLMPLTTHSDSRGDLTEIFRNEWHESPPSVHWLISRSGPNVLRGVHVHLYHWDYLCVIGGEMMVGLHDMRPEPSAVASAMLRLNGTRLQLLAIPPGVAHGFYTPSQSAVVVGASRSYDATDHRACRWDSPELGLDWPCAVPKLSARDRDAGTYAELKSALRIGGGTAVQR